MWRKCIPSKGYIFATSARFIVVEVRERGGPTPESRKAGRPISAGHGCSEAGTTRRSWTLADDPVDPTTRNGRVAESCGHWRQWFRWYASDVFAAVVVHVQTPLGSAVCKALLAKGMKVTSVR